MEKMDKIGDPLIKMRDLIPWEKLFREPLDRIFRGEQVDKGAGGRPAYDSILMFKILILQRTYSLSDEEMEYQINDRLSFQRFLNLNLSDNVPDARTIWLYREKLKEVNNFKKLFNRFQAFLEQKNLVAYKGVIVDATFIEVPKQRNDRDENKEIKEGKKPEDWSDKKTAHKDREARWMKKDGKSYYGYKNHVKADKKSKLIVKYGVTDARTHDSQVLEDLLDKKDSGHEIYGDSAYRSAKIEKMLKRRNIRSRIHIKGYSGNRMTKEQMAMNRKKSRIRARVEHIFGHMQNGIGDFIRSVGMVRAKINIGMMNLAYNMERYLYLATR
jgi:IS5 family transposase